MGRDTPHLGETMRDLHNNVKVSRAISPTRVADNTALVGEIIDKQGFDSLEYLIAYGTLADAAATFVTLLEHGDDSGLSDAAAVPDADLLGSETTVDQDADDTVQKLGYVGDKRFTRLTITPADNATAADISAVAVQSNADERPVS